MINKFKVVKRFIISQKEWNTIQVNYYNNPIPEYKDGATARMFKSDGSAYTMNDYRAVEKSIKEGIRNQNNPIELSEKVKYPDQYLSFCPLD